MANNSSFLQYLKTREGRFSLVLVVACGVALAFFIGTTFFVRPPASYHLDFGKAQWIEPADPGTHGYYRKTLYLSGRVDRAWIELAATDNYTLYVNGLQIDLSSFASICVQGVYDLKKALRPGKNVIAISVVRDSFPGAGQLRVRGFYGLVGSPLQEFVSEAGDKSWRASITPDGIVGGYDWNTTQLDDSSWKLTKIGQESGRGPITDYGGIDPRLLESKPVGKWIAPPQGAASQASFSYDFPLPAKRRETWLEVAATGNYDLFINGQYITTQVLLKLPVTGIAPLTNLQPLAIQPTLLAYNITRWLHAGTNSIRVRVTAESLRQALLLADGYTVLPNGNLRRFATDGNWKTLLFSNNVKPALAVADYGDQPWGDLVQQPAAPLLAPISDLRGTIIWCAVVAAVLGGVLVLWLLASMVASLVTGLPRSKLWTCDALFHLCVLVLMLFLWLLCSDVRLESDWCFKPLIVYSLVGLLLAGKLLLYLPRKSSSPAELSSPSAEFSSAATASPNRFRRYWLALALLCIVFLGFYLRVRDLTFMSLDVDEYGVIQFSQGVQEKGYPFIRLGSFDKEVTTYELVSYSIAVPRQFLGETETAYRTCALIYSTLTIALMGIAGTRMMGWRVGLVAAFIFATYPSGIFWGHNAFWPSQEQLFSLATIWCFYEATRPGGPLRRGFLNATTVCFILAYWTWEGGGFLLPTMFALMYLRRWGTYDWIRDWHLWRCSVVIVFAVGIQLTHREVASLPPFMQTGISLSDITTPQPVWLDITHYYPAYYFAHVFFAENHFMMTLMAMFGIVFCWRYPAVRYLFVALVSMVFWYTEFLPAYAIRYAFASEGLLILLSTGIVFKLVDWVASVRVTKLRWLPAAGLLGMFVLSTNGFVLHSYRLAHSGSTPFYGGREGIYRCDYRGAAKYVADHFKPGDGLLVAIPHVFEFYSGLKANYSFNTMLDKKITYSGAMDVPHYLDKFSGHPCVRSLEELQDLRGRFKRIWLVQVPFANTQNQTPLVVKYLAANSRVAYESYRAVVNLMVATPNANQPQYGPPAYTQTP